MESPNLNGLIDLPFSARVFQKKMCYFSIQGHRKVEQVERPFNRFYVGLLWFLLVTWS